MAFGLMEGTQWTRGALLGRGSFGAVNLAFAGRGGDVRPAVMAVKSAPVSHSVSLRQEKAVLLDLQACPQVVRCFGDDVTADAATGARLYNLFLEYADGGTLSDALCRNGGSLPEPVVRRYARSIVRGLGYVHARGYAHCDVKPQNILVCGGGSDVKIADFGLAKKTGGLGGLGTLRGTSAYMSPESVARGEHGAPADIWSLGCVVAEMATGAQAWRPCGDLWGLLWRIGYGEELPEIPPQLSEEGKDFLRRCFVRDPGERWTAEMLLQHPFVAPAQDPTDAAAIDGKACSSIRPSPRSGLEFSQWSEAASLHSASEEWRSPELDFSPAADRIRDLATSPKPNWSSSARSSDDGWMDVRIHGISFSSEEPMESQERKTEHDSEMMLEGHERGKMVDLVDAASTSDDNVQIDLLPLSIGHRSRTERCGSDSSELSVERSHSEQSTDKSCLAQSFIFKVHTSLSLTETKKKKKCVANSNQFENAEDSFCVYPEISVDPILTYPWTNY